MDVGSLKSIGDASVTARRRCCSKAARTPSPSALRQRMLQNCMSAIKSKRNDLIQRYRSEGFSDRQVFARQLLNEAYQASMDQTVNQIQPRQQRSGDESIDHPNELRADNPFANESELLENLGEAEHEELMRQIAEAVEAELFENYRPLNDTCRGSSVGYIDEDLLMMESDELDGVSELDYGINGVNESSFDAEIICPVCTSSVMVIAQGSGGDLVCECGVSISLHPPGSSINKQDRDERNSLAVGQLKQRLADTYDR